MALPNISRILQLSRRKRKVKGLREQAKKAGKQQKVEQANRILKKTRKEMYDIKKSPGMMAERQGVMMEMARKQGRKVKLTFTVDADDFAKLTKGARK